MNYEIIKKHYPLPPNRYEKFFDPAVHPRLNPCELDTLFLVGSERTKLKSPTNGDASIVLYYHKREGMLASFGTEHNDLKLLQLQGAHTRMAYRVVTGLNCVHFFAEEAIAIAQLPESQVARITSPIAYEIPGVLDGENPEQTLLRYDAFIVYALLKWSAEEHAFIRDFPQTHRTSSCPL